MSVLICDELVGRDFIEQRKALGIDGHDEVWEGVYVVAPLANNEHQAMMFRLVVALAEVFPAPSDVRVFPGVNVSDRDEGWMQNFRVPDVAVFFPGNPAKDCDTHWCGGPDWATEIASDGDRSREKLEFYAKVGVRELLLIDRDPWGIELYQLQGGELALAGISNLDQPNELKSSVFPLSFRLVQGLARPVVQVVTTDGNKQWHV